MDIYLARNFQFYKCYLRNFSHPNNCVSVAKPLDKNLFLNRMNGDGVLIVCGHSPS
jgi:hypothetical protein